LPPRHSPVRVTIIATTIITTPTLKTNPGQLRQLRRAGRTFFSFFYAWLKDYSLQG
jgi:hypothetical protein